jgi:hydrogenase maturation protein HypF
MAVTVRGAVQGVGFRPFVYRLASELDLAGWVINASDGVHIEVEGGAGSIDQFIHRLQAEHPPHAMIQSVDTRPSDPLGEMSFQIRKSASGAASALILPDLAMCPECRHELFDTSDRRYRYPFLNCTHCGPRFSIVIRLPYDRPNTTMTEFELCPECRAEYENPLDRRFHAQPTACPKCGPELWLAGSAGGRLADHGDALLQAEAALSEGQIVAVKGIGGFHLMCDARNEDAVMRLRHRKRREEKPLAVMSPNLDDADRYIVIDDSVRELLTSREAPIVLAQKRENADQILAPSIAPGGNPHLGVMLPYTPLHALLLDDLGYPLVATSGNLTDEPICIDNDDAVRRLSDIADLFLLHDRPIARHVDDSVIRVMDGEAVMSRRARGYAPLPVQLPRPMPRTLAVGGQLKNAVALAVNQDAFISQHIGDLDSEQAFSAFEDVIDQFTSLYETPPALIIHDTHPDYLSTRWTRKQPGKKIKLQHHAAHVYSCMAEHGLEGPAFGISWDGTGYGLDGTVWGGEFIIVDKGAWRRSASMRTFPLPGGESAIREPRRTALGLLMDAFGPEKTLQLSDLAPVDSFSAQEKTLLAQAVVKSINSPRTSSMGRLFDAVASLLNLRQVMSYEGQAAMELEWALPSESISDCYEIPLVADNTDDRPLRYDWQPMLEKLLEDLRNGVADSVIAARFHNALAELAVSAAQDAEIHNVTLTGGCFQNKYLTERTCMRLREEGFTPLIHRSVPPGDGGIALGQLYAASLGVAGG